MRCQIPNVLTFDIPRVQHRLLLCDEQHKNTIDTFFVTVKEELDITPAQVQVIEIVQEKEVYPDEGVERRVFGFHTRMQRVHGTLLMSISCSPLPELPCRS